MSDNDWVDAPTPAQAKAPQASDDGWVDAPTSQEAKSSASTGVDKLMNTPFLKREREMVNAQLSPQGVQQMAASSMLPAAASTAMQGMGAAGRIGMNALTGGTAAVANEDPNASIGDKAGTFAKGGAVGGLISAAGEGIGGLLGKLKSGARKMARLSPSESDAYLADPKGVQSAADSLEDGSASALLQKSKDAQDAIQNSRRGLRAEGLGKASQLSDLIKGKTAKINPSEWMGLSPELDEAIQAHANPYNQLPREVEVPLDTIQSAKRAAQSQASYKPGTVYDPTQSAKIAEMGDKASRLRQMVEDVVPEAKGLNGEMQQNVLLGKDLRSALKHPLASTSTSNPDKLAKLALTDSASGNGGLFDYATKQSAAKAIAKGDVGSGITSVPLRFAAKQALRGANALQNGVEPVKKALTSPEAQVALQNLLQNLSQEKK